MRITNLHTNSVALARLRTENDRLAGFLARIPASENRMPAQFDVLSRAASSRAH